MDFETLIINRHDEIMTVTVNRSEALNALSVRTLTELKQLLRSLAADSGYAVRGVVLTGAGDRAFIAGADIREWR